MHGSFSALFSSFPINVYVTRSEYKNFSLIRFLFVVPKPLTLYTHQCGMGKKNKVVKLTDSPHPARLSSAIVFFTFLAKQLYNFNLFFIKVYDFSMNSPLQFDNCLVYIPELLEYPFQSGALRWFSKLI